MSLTDRTRDFGLRIVRLCEALPQNTSAQAIARQLVKAGTSPGAHFREALRARSKSEYVAKLNGGLMELEEAAYWLEMVEARGLLSARRLAALRKETGELISIFVSLINKWRPRSPKGKAKQRPISTPR